MWKMTNQMIALTMAVEIRKTSVYQDRYQTPILSHSGQTRKGKKKKARDSDEDSDETSDEDSDDEGDDDSAPEGDYDNAADDLDIRRKRRLSRRKTVANRLATGRGLSDSHGGLWVDDEEGSSMTQKQRSIRRRTMTRRLEEGTGLSDSHSGKWNG